MYYTYRSNKKYLEFNDKEKTYIFNFYLKQKLFGVLSFCPHKRVINSKIYARKNYM